MRLLSDKPHYFILDGLRGVAAILVVAYHIFEVYATDTATGIINHGYLAVDFFFVLSGFVVAYAYDDRWRKMTLKQFFERRLIRLHPLVILGIVIGVVLFYFGSCGDFPLVARTPFGKVMVMALLSCFMIPALPSMDIRGWAELYPLNGSSWTLFWEYLANIGYALVVRHLSKSILIVLTIIAAFLTVNVTMNIDILGWLRFRGANTYTMNGGWVMVTSEGFIGVSRVLYPYLIGMLLFRMNKTICVKGAFWVGAVLLIILLAMPRLGVGDYAWLNGLYESIAILVAFPFIVSVGAGSAVMGTSQRLCKVLGKISYPLYITHFPFIYVQDAWVRNHQGLPLSIHILVNAVLFIVLIAVALIVAEFYDAPVRAWLKRRLSAR